MCTLCARAITVASGGYSQNVTPRKCSPPIGEVAPPNGRSHLQALFTTGFTRKAVVHGGVLDAGVNFFAKPFAIEQLAAKVGEVVN